MDDHTAVCKRDFLRQPLDGVRDVRAIRYIVLHDTEGGTARGVAAYFQHNDSGYTHLVVDDQECYRCLRNDAIPRGAPYVNTNGFHIEQCGYAKWSAVLWFSHRRTLQRAAYKTALHCKAFNLPVEFRTADQLLRGFTGITTHAEATKAFGPAGGHTDPGPFWPRRYFMRLVRRYFTEIAS